MSSAACQAPVSENPKRWSYMRNFTQMSSPDSTRYVYYGMSNSMAVQTLYYNSTIPPIVGPPMPIENYRKKLISNPRHWGDQVPYLPHSPATRGSFDPSPISSTSSESDLHDRHSLTPPPSPDPPPDPPAEPLESTYIQIPIPANTTMISTKGWTLNSLLNQSINFHRVPRVSVLSSSLLQYIKDYENSGVPLVIEDCHKHQNWNPDEFTLDSFASATSQDIRVRNIHDWQDTTIPLSDFIKKTRSIATIAEEGEQERFYGKDAPCPKRWEEWLRRADVVPKSLLCGGPQDFFRYRPQSSLVETLMCYLGVGDTFTPCHKDLCASSGQNLMCHTENDGSSFWFMTESASALEVAEFFHSLGREIDHEDYVITVEELSNAPFKVYILEQKLGDLVLVPPRSAHQVVNFGGITVKTSWSRMTLKGLVTAYHHELPIYRRVCRPETYRVKSTIRHVLLGLTNDLRRYTNGREDLVSNIRELLVVFDRILAEEESDIHSNDLSPDETNITENVVCDICGADIFQGFFECRTCVEVDSAEGGYAVCPGCYAEGRSCKHQIMQPMQRRPFKSLLNTREEAIQVVDMYERRHGRTFQLSDDYCDRNNSYLRTFRAALVLLDIYKTKNTRVCTLRLVDGGSHTVPFSWGLYCKKCHHAKCFSHVLSEHRTHSVEALLLHHSDNTHQKYHYNHTAGRKARFGISMADPISSPLELPQLVYYANHFTYCKPIKTQFMKLGWYDANAHMSHILDDQQSPAEMGSTLVPDATVSISAEKSPIVVQPPTNNTPEFTVKHTMKRKAYVLVPAAPYRHRRSQENSSTSALSVTRDELQPTANRPEQKVPPSQVDGSKVPKAPTIASTPSLSDIGISIPTIIRMPGSSIMHAPHVTQHTGHLVKPVNPRTVKPPYVANPVAAQSITKRSFSTFKFKKSKVKPTLNNTTIVASTDTQGGRKSPNLPQSQPAPPMPLPEVSALTELIADKVIHRLTANSGQPMVSLSNNNGITQTSYSYDSHPQQHSGPPPQYNGPPHPYDPQQHISSPRPFRHYRPAQQQTVQFNFSSPQQRPQHNGPPPYSNSHEDNSHIPFHQDIHRFPQKQGPVQSAGKMGYVNRSQDHHNDHPNGRNKMPGFKQRSNKRRKYNNPQDSQSQSQHPISPRFNHVGRPPQGPRGRYYNSAHSTPRGPRGKYHNSAQKHSTPQRGEYHDGVERSTSRDHLPSPWKTSSEGTLSSNLLSQSEYFQSQVAPGNREPEIEQSTQGQQSTQDQQSIQGRTNNGDANDDVIEIDSYGIAPLETLLPMADPTLPNPRIEQDDDGLYSNDSVMDTDGEAEIPVDNLPTFGDQGNDDQGNEQIWEDNYAKEDRTTEVLSAPQSAPQQAPANTGALDSIFNVADDSMFDVTDNPWTSSP